MATKTAIYRTHYIGGDYLSQLQLRIEEWLNAPNAQYKKIISTQTFFNGTIYIFIIIYIPKI